MLVGATLLLTSCEPAAKRCDRVHMEGLIHDLLTSRAERLPNDTSKVPPPPKPSDVQWYNESCWEGKPR
jgi:hypothetical protein